MPSEQPDWRRSLRKMPAPLLEEPGFLMINYGRATPVVGLAAHIAYGAIVGSFVFYGSR